MLVVVGLLFDVFDSVSLCRAYCVYIGAYCIQFCCIFVIYLFRIDDLDDLIMDLVSHNTYVVCVNFSIYGGTYNLKLTPNDKFFLEKLLMAILFTL